MSTGMMCWGDAAIWGEEFLFCTAEHGEEWCREDLTESQLAAMSFFKKNEKLLYSLVQEAIEEALAAAGRGSPRDELASDQEGAWALADEDPQYRYSEEPNGGGFVRQEDGSTFQINRITFFATGQMLLGGSADWDPEHGVGVVMCEDEVLEVGPYTDLC